MSKSIQSSNAEDAREMFRRLRRHSKSLKPHSGDEGTHEERYR